MHFFTAFFVKSTGDTFISILFLKINVIKAKKKLKSGKFS